MKKDVTMFAGALFFALCSVSAPGLFPTQAVRIAAALLCAALSALLLGTGLQVKSAAANAKQAEWQEKLMAGIAKQVQVAEAAATALAGLSSVAGEIKAQAESVRQDAQQRQEQLLELLSALDDKLDGIDASLAEHQQALKEELLPDLEEHIGGLADTGSAKLDSIYKILKSLRDEIEDIEDDSRKQIEDLRKALQTQGEAYCHTVDQVMEKYASLTAQDTEILRRIIGEGNGS